MQVFVYRSRRRDGTYVYLARRDDFAVLPEPLRSSLGEVEFALEFALTPQRRLAQEDPAVVHRNLAARGFHVQFPPPAVVRDERG